MTWQLDLKVAMLNGVSVDDVREIIGKQVQLAKAGDSKAAKFIVDLTGGNKPVKITNIYTDAATAARIANQERKSRE